MNRYEKPALRGLPARRSRFDRRQLPSRGFTLIEMLAVMLLAALMASIALPAMQKWFESVGQRAQLTEVAIQFQRLAARAALLSQTVALSKASWRENLADGEPALALPEGWSVESEKPLLFYSSGVCAGGEVSLRGPGNIDISLRISPPTCDVNIVR